jgi:hypothetical protein
VFASFPEKRAPMLVKKKPAVHSPFLAAGACHPKFAVESVFSLSIPDWNATKKHSVFLVHFCRQ